MSMQNVSTQLPDNTTKPQPIVRPLYVVLGIIGVLLLAGLFIWAIIWLAQGHAQSIEAVRDIFIIFLALESCLFGIAFLILLVMIIRLVNMLEFEIKPLLEKTNDTVGTIRGTTNFVSENVVQPVTRARVQVAGVTRALKVLFGNPSKNLED
ncbi:MAG: hypothetical protein KC419_19010 [Anaerolineales bacterium]|nr:hypothetical protein [Anaerolineales bacterium]